MSNDQVLPVAAPVKDAEPVKAPQAEASKAQPGVDKDGYNLRGDVRSDTLQLLEDIARNKTRNDDGSFTLQVSADVMDRVHAALAD